MSSPQTYPQVWWIEKCGESVYEDVDSFASYVKLAP